LSSKRLNNKLQYILSFAILFLVLPFWSSSKTDTISGTFKVTFQKNLDELNDLYCWSDTSFKVGKCEFKTVHNVREEFQNLNLPFYNSYLEEAELFYRFFDEMEIEKKTRLVHFFSIYEKEFNRIFRKEELPIEIKYLAPALSVMNPKADGENQRAGVWQLTHFQGLLNGNQINKLIDERYDILLSTQTVVNQIEKNLEQFKTLDLALAAYLMGNVKVRNAAYIAEKRGEDILNILPDSYVENIAAFQAMAVFLNANKPINNNLPVIKSDLYIVKVHRQIHFQQVSDVIGVSEAQLQFLNPQFKFSIVPVENKATDLRLPKDRWDDFLVWQDSIYSSYDSLLFQLVTQKIEYPPAPNRQYVREPVKDLEIEGKTKIKYRLKTGDVLGIIAEIYDVRVADLKYWNNIYNERRIQAGKNLDIFVDDDKVEYYLSLAQSQTTGTNGSSINQNAQKTTALTSYDINNAKKIEHVVKSGESPYLIAKKYDGVTPDLILQWNNIDDARKIQIGQKLIVYLKQ